MYPDKKQVRIALTHIFGIGTPRAVSILEKAGIDPNAKMVTLDEDQLNKIRNVIEQEGNIEGDLRKEVSMNIKRLIEIQSYRGLRHRRSLPVRGQRTHTNRAPVKARVKAPSPGRRK